MIKQTALTIAEQAIQTALSLDSSASEVLAPLDNKVVELTMTQPDHHLFVFINRAQVMLLGTFDGEADLSLSGTSQQFLRLVRERGPNALMLSGVSIRGEVGVLNHLLKAIQRLDFDLEGAVAKFLGESGAHFIGRQIRSLGSRLALFGQQAERSASEYLKYESKLQPSPEAFVQFSEDVQRLKQDLDRFEAKFNAYKASL